MCNMTKIINTPLYFYTSLNECTNDIPTHNIISDLDHTLRKFFTITILEPHFKIYVDHNSRN